MHSFQGGTSHENESIEYPSSRRQKEARASLHARIDGQYAVTVCAGFFSLVSRKILLRKEIIMKYTNKLKITRSLSFLLVMLMLLLQVPFSAVAEGDAVAPPTSDDVTLEGEAELFEFETISTVREVAEWREENVKHFTLPNGTYQAVTYADPVHRKDDAGVWQDIDNSLSLQSFKGVSLLANADMRTVFAPSFAANTPLFTLSENGYSISMSYLSTGSGLELTAIGAEMTPAAVTNAPTRTKTEWESIEEASTVDNKTSIVYSGVRTNTDLEYILQGNDIKENIIVKAPATSYVYRFELALVGLTAQMNEDGSISLRDATTGDAKYSIPAPYMVDANGERSNEVAYTLTALSTGGYRLTVTANAAWINAEERAFPVKIDPSINYDTGIIDTHISSQQPNTSFGNYEELVIAPNYGSYAYIKIDLPTLPAGADVISANLHTDFYYEGTLGSWVMLGSYKVTSAWTENMTWNTHLAGEGTIDTSDYVELVNVTNFSGMSDYWNGTALWNITNVLEGWYQNPNTNHGMAFHYEYDDPYTVYIKSSEAAFGCPYMTVQYSYLADGVYAITSAAYIRWMTVENDSTEAGAALQQTNVGEGPVASFDRSSLFKISYRASTDSYIIRSMLNNNLGLGYSNDMTKVITKTIPSIDAQVPDFDTFHIEWNEEGNGFVIYRHLSSYVIHLSAPATANLTTVSKNSATATSLWHFGKYTGEDQSGVDISFGTLIAGESYTETLVVWSTVIDANTPQAYISSGSTSVISFDWDSTNHLFTLAAHNEGSVTVAYRINKKLPNNSTENVYQEFVTITAELPYEEGIYYFKNMSTQTYLQVDDVTAPNYSTENASLEVLPFVADEHQRWELEHISNGYYKIISVKSGKVLAVQSAYENTANQVLVQQTYSTAYRQMWKLEKITDYGYVLRPKSAEAYSIDWCMGTQAASDGYRVVQTAYTLNAEESDEWQLACIKYVSSVALEGQKKSLWCWATSARMFAKHFYPSVTYTQNQAVKHIKGSEDNLAGNVAKLEEAVQYYISNIDGACIDSIWKDDLVYSKESLLRFLDDGYVVAIGRSEYSNFAGSNVRVGGHFTLIFGYIIVNGEHRFLIRDSLPVNLGETKIMSYEMIFNGQNPQNGENADHFAWDSVVVINTSYANETIPCYNYQ